MNQSEVIFYIIQIVVCAITAFTGILVWNKTRDSAWMCIVSGVITLYLGQVYELLVKLGIINVYEKFSKFPLLSFIFFIIPMIFFVAGFIIKIFHSK